MGSKILVLGYGAVGQATTQRLQEKGYVVTVAQRKRPNNLPSNVNFKQCDILTLSSVSQCLEGFDQLVIAIGFEYNSAVWQQQWPIAMSNIVAASSRQGIRVIFVDNLYMYGPQAEPIHEEMNLTNHPGKPAVRAEITRIWQDAVKQNGLRFTALRAPDFFGPGVLLSHLGEVVFGSLAKGGTAQFFVPTNQPHDFAFVPDMARAVCQMLEAGDEIFGQVWHMPCAPTTTIKKLVELGAKSLGVTPKMFNIPLWLLRIMGYFMPLAREIWEMRFQWDRPYHVKADKFRKKFLFEATSFDESIPTTALSFRYPTTVV